MNRITQRKIGTLLVAVSCLAAPAALAVDRIPLTGALAGRVTNAAGVPQMGATVFLYNRFERFMERAFTNERGTVLFDALAPDV